MNGKNFAIVLLVVLLGVCCGGGWWLHAQNQRHELRKYESRRQAIISESPPSASDLAELDELNRRIGDLRADGVKP